MIGYLKGKVFLKGGGFIILEINGVGYKVVMVEINLEKLEEGSIAEVFTWPHLRRETIDLYGCLSREEFSLFEILEKMPGVGPKTALLLASAGSLEKLKKAIEEKDEEFLSRMKRVGQKKTQRVLLELTGKIKKMEKEVNLEREESLELLIGLGFTKGAAKEAILKVPKEIKESEEIVKSALKILGEKPTRGA